MTSDLGVKLTYETLTTHFGLTKRPLAAHATCLTRAHTLYNTEDRTVTTQRHSARKSVSCLIRRFQRVNLKLGRVLELSNVIFGGDLFEDLFAVVRPESLGGVLSAVLEQDLLSSRVLSGWR